MAPSPANILGVMVSSTFTDLETHRAALIKTMLLMKGNHRISVLNMPWYLDEGIPKEKVA